MCHLLNSSVGRGCSIVGCSKSSDHYWASRGSCHRRDNGIVDCGHRERTSWYVPRARVPRVTTRLLGRVHRFQNSWNGKPCDHSLSTLRVAYVEHGHVCDRGSCHLLHIHWNRSVDLFGNARGVVSILLGWMLLTGREIRTGRSFKERALFWPFGKSTKATQDVTDGKVNLTLGSTLLRRFRQAFSVDTSNC